MKSLICTLSLCLVFTLTWGQGPPDHSKKCKEAMTKLAYLAGEWKGEATYRTGPGPAQTITQQESVTWKLDSMVLLIEGRGTKRDASISRDITVFNAVAVINYNPFKGEYELKSFVKEGMSTDAYFKILDENQFEWGFDIPSGAKIKYVITLDPKNATWHEVGEYTQGDQSWKYIEVNLKKM